MTDPTIELVESLLFQSGTKLERARDLFEQCLDGCPPKFSKGMCTCLFGS